MKFGNGCWLQKEGIECFAPQEAYFVNRNDHEVVICAPTHHIAHSTYPYIYTNHYTDQKGGIWAATKAADDKDYTAPTANGKKVASNVGYDGTKLRIYIWMEGTDADS